MLHFYQVLCLPGTTTHSDELKTNRKCVKLLQKCHREGKIISSARCFDVVKELVLLQEPKLFSYFCRLKPLVCCHCSFFLICFITSFIAVTSLHCLSKCILVVVAFVFSFLTPGNKCLCWVCFVLNLYPYVKQLVLGGPVK